MSLKGKKWVWPEYDRERAQSLSRLLDIYPALARLLINRGIKDPEEARAFLNPSLDQLFSPWDFCGMKHAVERIFRALENGEQIHIHGDYDADGITATVILVEALEALGGSVLYYLPSRFAEGYGLHKLALDQFRKDGSSLVITVDCGINSNAEINHARSIGLDMIITDHHRPLIPLGTDIVALNPLLAGCSYPFKELSGAGIAFKLASALYEKAGKSFPVALLDLVALGTAADVVPLIGENRVLVAAGLEQLRTRSRPGLCALMEAAALTEEKISGTALSFILAPPINAAGRLGDARPAAELLLEKRYSSALLIAKQLYDRNRQRREIEFAIFEEAEKMVLDEQLDQKEAVITLGSQGWHHGVIGIVASRLVERFNRPVALVAFEGDRGRGSARSLSGIDITAAFTACAPLLERFGGHEQAAGFTVATDKFPALAHCLSRHVSEIYGPAAPKRRLRIDAELTADEIEPGLIEQLEKLQPFGMSNPAPVFSSRSWVLNSKRAVGKDKSHLKLEFHKDDRRISPIFFSGAVYLPDIERAKPLDLAFKMKNGFFRGEKTLEIEIKDMQTSEDSWNRSVCIFDQRGVKERRKALSSLLAGDNSKALVYVSTLSRMKKLTQIFPPGQTHCFSTGAGSGLQNGQIQCSSLIFFDLPLSEDTILKIHKGCRLDKPLKIYLLYSSDDRKINSQLLDLALPTKESVQMVIEAAARLTDMHKIKFPGPLTSLFDQKAGPSFWVRTAEILKEAGLLQGDYFLPDRVAEGESLPAGLDNITAYKEAAGLRDSCDHFQKLLLNSSSGEVADCLEKLIFGR